jgi:hypothetical protein
MRTSYILPALLLLTAPLASAQDAVRITDIAQMVRKPDLAKDPAIRSGMQAAGMDEERMNSALSLGKSVFLPAGLSSDSALAANIAAGANYKAHRVCNYTDEAGPKVLVKVPVDENTHMPEDLRSDQDLYLVLPEGALGTALTDAMRPKPSPGPNWKAMPAAKITAADGVFATYDLGSDADVLAKLTGLGMSQAEIDAVVFRSHERNWPAGIDSFERRYPKLKHFRKYKAFEAAHWDDKVLLVIPYQMNKRMPIGTRPHMDIYMVYAKSAVTVKQKK